jgi:hypothetical protein
MDKLREVRNQLLINCDFRMFPDYPYASGALRNDWVNYRQALRDLPQVSTPSLDVSGNLVGVTWPTPPQ